MIRPKLFRINLDLKNRNYITDIIVSQGDQRSNIFRFNLVQDNIPYDLTGLSVKAYFERPDKLTSFISGIMSDAEKGIVDVELTNQILNSPGVATCQVMIIGSDQELLSSLKISFMIEKSLNYSTIESAHEYNALVDALSEMQAIKNDFDFVIANATSDSELILARGSYLTLRDRLNAADQLTADKVDKVEGKHLSTEDYSTDEKQKLSGIEPGATADMTAEEIKAAYESNADTNAYTDAEKAKVSNLPSNTNLELSDKAQKLKATNLVVNGDFSQGTTGWIGSYCTNSTAGNVLTSRGDGSQVYFRTTQVFTSFVPNRKYYFRAKITVDLSAQPSYVTLVLRDNNGNGTKLIEVLKTSPTVPEHVLSGIGSMAVAKTNDVYAYAQVAYTSPEIQNGKTLKLEYIKIIDLTATFGAGNEPTVEQMDRLLAEFQNSWFDGTQEILPLKTVVELLGEKANKAQEAWVTPTLTNGTTGQAGNIPQYFKDQFGIVHLRGKAIQPTNGQFLFTLPVGYRPITDLKIVVSGNNAFAILRISTGGQVYLASGNGAEISLDNIRFRAEG